MMPTGEKMKKEKQRKLEKAGWKAGDTADFLELTKEEAALIDMKISLSRTFCHLRKKAKLTQVQVANILHTSQSGVAKMEVGDPSVSMELLVKGMIKLGASKKTEKRRKKDGRSGTGFVIAPHEGIGNQAPGITLLNSCSTAANAATVILSCTG